MIKMGDKKKHELILPTPSPRILSHISDSTVIPENLWWICKLSYPGYSHRRIPDIHTLVYRIFISSYPGYSHRRTPDMHILVTRMNIPSYPGYVYPLTYL